MDRVEKLFFVDVETTGVDSNQNALTQVAGDVCIINESKELQSLETFNFDIQPWEGAVIEPEALKVTGKTEEEIMAYPSSESVYKEFVALLDRHCNKFDKKDKMVMLGYNVRFDEDYLRKWFERQGNPYIGSYFWYPPIDIMNLAMFDIGTKRSRLVNFKLGTVAANYGLTPDGKLHDAMADIKLTKDLFWTLVKRKYK